MTATYLNRLGLALGIIGVVLIFVWGPPQPSLEEATFLTTEGPLDLVEAAAIRRRRRRHEVLSRIGLGFVGAGFAAQFCATY